MLYNISILLRIDRGPFLKHALTNFEPYLQFLELHLDALKKAGPRILDLGAGTGNLTFELLRADKEVFALDHSDAMLERLQSKCGQMNKRLHIIKQNIETLEVIESLGELGKFDGVVMLNVLFTLKNPRRCLEMCFKVLAKGGVLVFSWPRADIDLSVLLEQIRVYLQDKGLWGQFRDHYQTVRARNDYMSSSKLLKQFGTDEQVKFLEDIGFRVTNVIANGYCGDDMLIEARKK
jgi:SAM-dependent methyltransferase